MFVSHRCIDTRDVLFKHDIKKTPEYKLVGNGKV